MTDDTRNKCLAWVQTLENPVTKFSLGAIIGTGDSATVHEGTDSDGKSVAIKIQDETEDTVQDIFQEFQMLSETCTGNQKFPVFFGAYRTVEAMPHRIWFVMELCERGSLQDLLLRLKVLERFMKEDIIAYILREVLLGLNELHEQSIIHRDVKASNILICKNGDIKICDFGFAKHVGTPQGKIQSVVGSPYWMAPEVVVSDRHPDLAYDTRADVWSLGITAVEIGDCEAPTSNVYAPRALFQVVQNPPPTLHKPSDWSQLFNDFIVECLEKNPDHRPWSEELLEHPFINEVAEQENRLRGSLLHLLNELQSQPKPDHVPEVTVKSEMIKTDRSSAPQPMYRDDLATLYTVTEESVMETLSQRFAQGNIYTFLGDILIVINPFHEHSIYSSEVAEKYKYRARCDNLPHIYAVGDRAYQDMLHHQEVQNIILTGETGSGKTTSFKHLLWQITNFSASNTKMVERMLNVSTIMEAFGNAATIFNPNSTRHIQYLELTFTKSGKLSGGILWAYCLEKWRVTNCGRNQSNFHIFYYLMDTLSATDQAEKYNLEKGKNYAYLPSSPSHNPQTNVEKFSKVKDAFNLLDFSIEEQDTIVKILSAILLMGHINYKGEDEVEIQNPEVVEKIAELLQVEDKKLIWTLTNYCVVTGGEPVRGKNNFDEAEETRDSLARSLYCRLVDWIVNLINTKLSFTRLVFGDQHSMGILDIPGFECFAQDNTLDQFLVNITNEQMQFFYNQRIFIWEMQDYEKDNLNASGYNFHDNQEMLDMVLSKPKGLLAYLDNETKSSGNDHKHLLDQIESKLETRFIQVTDASNFTVYHYSGQVIYDARNFIERNKNFLSPEVIQVLRDSGNPTVSTLFTNQMTKTGNLTIAEEDVKQTRWTNALSAKPHQNKKFNTKSRGKYSQSRQMQTIAATMRNSLLEMLQKVSEGSSHFVRCLRSNLKCTPFAFDRDLIRYQIRALGVMDSLRARQLGYSRRLKFPEFLRRYKFLAFDFNEHVEETKDNCRLLLIRLKMEGWALGDSKVFLKYYNEEYLSRLYENQVHKVVKIQSLMRAFLARKKTNTKFPRLAELRNQASISSREGPGLLGLRKIKLSQLEASKAKIARGANERSPSPVENEYRPNSSSSYNTKSSTPELNPGYTKVYSSKNGRSTSSEGVNLRNSPNKPPRRSLSPPNPEDITERPSSPRDIAKAFEAKFKENRELTFGARYKPSRTTDQNLIKNPIKSNSMQFNSKSNSPSSVSANNAKRNQPSSSISRMSTPEIINPLEELTNYSNKVMEDKSDPGPFNFQGMLRKTNANIRDVGVPLIPPPMPILNKLKSTKEASSFNKNILLQEQKSIEKPKTGQWSNNPYPLPGMAVQNTMSSNNNNPIARSAPTPARSVERSTPSPKKSIYESSTTDAKAVRPKRTDSIDKQSKTKSVDCEMPPPSLIFEGLVEDL